MAKNIKIIKNSELIADIKGKTVNYDTILRKYGIKYEKRAVKYLKLNGVELLIRYRYRNILNDILITA